jgi:repressor LexA
VQTAREHLEGLVSEGKLGKEPGKARGYRLVSELGSPPALVPLLGRVQAGALTEAVEDPDGYVAVQGHVASDELFALKVRGDSMMDAGILSGDMVIVRRQPSANSREIVVALIDGEATVKRLQIKRGRIELHPENAQFDPIIPDGDKLVILGKVIEIRRYLEGTPRGL